MELIPGLPDDVAYDCLVRVTYKEFATVASVCRGWKGEIESPEFRRKRRVTRTSQKVVVLAQARAGPCKKSALAKYQTPVYGLSVFEPLTGSWSDLPPAPGLENGLPLFCQFAGVGSGIVVLGGLDRMTWEFSNSVFVFDFASNTWRRGTDMPGAARLFFGCASDGNRTVYVVGGHDEEKNALKSAVAYDVVNDEWVPLPDMATERDECQAIFRGGRLHAIGGYCTELQGRFGRSAEVFDVATWQWDRVQEGFLASGQCPRTCVSSGNDGALYMCRGSDVVTRQGSKWQVIAKLPADVANVAYLAAWQGNLLALGSGGFGEPYMAYVLDLKASKWTQVETPQQYLGHVQSGCFLEI